MTAVVTLLAALTFPVFAAAKASAYKTACASNFRQASVAVSIYSMDYEDRFMPTSYKQVGERSGQNDKVWPQLLLPYLKEFGIFKCPADYGRRQGEGIFDEDLVVGDVNSRYYRASQRTNLGFNYLYLSPTTKDGDTWTVAPRYQSQIAKPSTTIVFADSVWDRDEKGRPFGGGRYVIIPPCRYMQGSNLDVDTFAMGGERSFYTPSPGWNTKDENSGMFYGGIWPWHSQRVNVIRADGSLKSMTTDQLSAGCDAQAFWEGYIHNPDDYPWDLR